MNAILEITEADGNTWKVNLQPLSIYTIGRGKDNDIVLNDRRASRRHAQIIAEATYFRLIDGYRVGGEIKRSVNQVFVNGFPMLEKILDTGDEVIIGETHLKFNKVAEVKVPAISKNENNEKSIIKNG